VGGRRAGGEEWEGEEGEENELEMALKRGSRSFTGIERRVFNTK